MEIIFSAVWGYMRSGTKESLFIITMVVIPIVHLIVIYTNKDLRAESSVYIAESQGRKTLGINGLKIAAWPGALIALISAVVLVFAFSYFMGYDK
jgi:hypothetical protein